MHDFCVMSRSVSESSHPVQILPYTSKSVGLRWLRCPVENRGETGKVHLEAHYSCALMQYAGHLWQGELHWLLVETREIRSPIKVCLKAAPTFSSTPES